MATPQRPLRTIAILNFIPAFPLCIAHGALSKNPFPAVGLIPLFFSAVFGVFIIPSPCNPRKQQQQQASQSTQHSHDDTRGLLTPDLEEQASGSSSGSGDDNETPGESSALLGSRRRRRTKNKSRSCTSDETGFLIFFVDLSLAAAILAVLVLTWVRTTTGAKDPEFNGALGMLAAYATIPLLMNFFIHLYLAIRGFIAGLALHGLVQYAAWHTLPPDCPHCGERLRPESTPEIPWAASLWTPRLPSLSTIRLPRPNLPSFPLPRLSLPRWLRWPRGHEQPLFVDDAQVERDQYRDDEHDDGEGGYQRGEPSSSTVVIATGTSDSAPPVVEEVVVGKKDKKKRTNSSGAAVNVEEEQAAWS